MSLTIHSDAPPLQVTADGAVRVAGTRIPLETVVRAHLSGQSPEQISENFDVLAVEDVYAVIGYYLRHRAEVEEYLTIAEREAEQIRQKIEQDFPQTGLCARLLARRTDELA